MKAWRGFQAGLDAIFSTHLLRVGDAAASWSGMSAWAGTPVICHDDVEPMPGRHLSFFNKDYVIVYVLSRGDPRNDRNGYRVRPPWQGCSRHFTKEFEALAVTLIREKAVKRAAKVPGESASRIWGRLFPHAKASYARLIFDDVEWLVADEVNR